MALRRGHGNGAGSPRVETLPPDELPSPVPAPTGPVAGVTRRQDGTVNTPEAARALGRQGGLVKAKRVRLARSLGLSADSLQCEGFAPYRRAASAFRRHHTSELALQSGGSVGAAPCSMVASAALQLAASRFLFDQAAMTGDPAIFKTASTLSNDSRQNLLAAYELAVREAEARAKAAGPVDPLAAFMLPGGDS